MTVGQLRFGVIRKDQHPGGGLVPEEELAAFLGAIVSRADERNEYLVSAENKPHRAAIPLDRVEIDTYPGDDQLNIVDLTGLWDLRRAVGSHHDQDLATTPGQHPGLFSECQSPVTRS